VTTCLVGRRLQARSVASALPVAGCARSAYRRHDPGRKARGHAERRCSGPVPNRPCPPALTLGGRSAIPALDPGRANAVSGGYVEVTNSGWVLRLRVSHGRDYEPAAQITSRLEGRDVVVVLALALPVVPLFVVLLTDLLARALLLI
jgi:hypothetical protein